MYHNIKRLLITCDFPPVPGGQSSFFGNLWSQAGPEDSSVLMVPRDSAYTSADHRLWKIIRFRCIRGEQWHRRIIRLGLISVQMLIALVVFRPREIHAGQLMVTGLPACAMSWLLNAQIFLYAFGSDVMEFHGRRWARPFLQRLFRESSLVFACSSFTASFIADRYEVREKIRLLHPGVEERFFLCDTDLTDHLKYRYSLHGKKVVLSLGRLIERKGFDMIIRSLPRMVDDVPNLHYLIGGEGPFKEKMENMVLESGLQEYVTFCGAIDMKELPSFYRLADVFAMIPRMLEKRGDVEGFGIVYLEANAAGIPIVASRSGGASDAVKNGVNGLIVNDPADPIEIAKKIKIILTDEQLKEKLSRQSLAWAEKFQWATQQQKWLTDLELYYRQ